MNSGPEKRVKFDFELFFTNGGSLKGEDFRLDIYGDDIDDEALTDYLIHDMRLLMVGTSAITNKVILDEAHKRNPEVNRSAPLLIDLSHTIENGLVTYKGLPAPIVCDYLSRADSRKLYEEGTEFQIGKIEMVTNTGTYIDCPFHRFEHGDDTSDVPLKRFADLEGTVIHLPFQKHMAITPEHLKGHELRNRAVLIHTGWDIHWNTPAYYSHHPFLTKEAAIYLKNCGVSLVGIDAHNIDDTSGNSRPVHTELLGAGILIVEHLCNLQLIPDSPFSFTAVPPKFKGVGTFPVRAFVRTGSRGN